MGNKSPKVTYLKDYKVPDFLIEHVDLVFELDKQKTRVQSKLKIKPNPSAQTKNDRLVLQGEALEFHSIAINGNPLDKNQYQLTENELIIDDVTEPCEVEICNFINPEKNTELRGLYISKNKFTTHCEAEGFRRITYFIDRPDVMATYTTTIIGDKKQCPFMLSNGNLVAERTNDDGRTSITWDDPFKKPSYLFALVAGDFDCVEDTYCTQSGRTIKLQFFAERGMGQRCLHAIDSLKLAMQWDEITYGRECDLDTYKVVAIADFNMGAMENKGLNIFNDKAVLAQLATVTDERHIGITSTVAHEYFHNWTGDRVTVRDWFQLTNKEGLTTFRNQSFIEEILSKAARAIHVKELRSRQFPEDAGPLAHPVQPKSYIVPDNFYTATVYRKGAEIYRMLETLLGTEAFQKGMSLYFTRHDGQAVTIEQYLAAMHDASDVDLSQFALWFHQAGTPEIEVNEHYIQEDEVYTLILKQSTKPTPGQPNKSPLVIPIRMGLISEDGKAIPLSLQDHTDTPLERVLVLDQNQQKFIFHKVKSKPILSLFRNFTAPVKVHMNTPESNYPILVQYDVDPFNRLEASQRYIMAQLETLMKQVQEKRPLTLSEQFIKTIDDILNTTTTDLWLLAEMLTIPSESYIADRLDQIDVESIHTAREFLISEIANKLQKSLLATYHRNNKLQSSSVEDFNIEEAGIRRLKNQCLSFLLNLHNTEIQNLAMQQFKQELPINMTNTMAILKALNQLTEADRDTVLSQSLALWQNESLALDNWFAAQAAAARSLDVIKALIAHPKFDIKQPNKVSALIGSFCENMTLYHDLSGKGYQFLAEIVLQLDKINPKVAADEAVFLTNWRRFDSARQALMKAALQSIIQQPISNRLFEIVSKSLEGIELQSAKQALISVLSPSLFHQLGVNTAVQEDIKPINITSAAAP